jgi:hypothetical protein
MTTRHAMRWATLVAVVFAGCADHGGSGDTRQDGEQTTVSDDFESGNDGTVHKLDDSRWQLSLQDDNGNADLPDTWRTWWYARFDHVQSGEPFTLTIDNNVWPYYYVPVYSYDQMTWLRFADSEVTQGAADSSITVTTRFAQPTVWIARFVPYTFTDLNTYLDTLRDSPFVSRQVVGTTQLGRPMEVLTITDTSVPDAGKQRIWLHGRTHPAETGSSFVLEGLIGLVLGDSDEAASLRAHFVFSILPMHNIDGVMTGNYRTTPESENLESMWFRDPSDMSRLTSAAPHEVQVLHDAMAATMAGPSAIPVSVALNLHSSNSEPDTGAFFFPHFGVQASGYTADQARLYSQQRAFADAVESFYAGKIEPRTEGGPSFVDNNFPESWWWVNRGADVMAMTIETVYGRAGFAPRWVTAEDMRGLGRAIGLAILRYHGLAVATPPPARSAEAPVLLHYPALYPPAIEAVVKGVGPVRAPQ